jgi:hypothetical protein
MAKLHGKMAQDFMHLRAQLLSLWTHQTDSEFSKEQQVIDVPYGMKIEAVGIH